jgi:hypothetical protein
MLSEILRITAIWSLCVVPKLLTLYTHHWRMGKKNKVVKLTPKKIRYIIRYKTNNISTKKIAEDLKLSPSTVKRVWMHWTRTKMPLNISKFGRKKKKIDEASEQLILEVSLINISGSFDGVEASTKSKISAQGVWKRS